MTDPRDEDLEDFFAAARDLPPQPSEAFLARMQAMSLAEQPVAKARVSEPRVGIWAQILETLGGWGAVSGLAAATVAGVWFGAAPPETISDSMSVLLYGADNLTLDPSIGFDFDVTEG